MGQEAEYRHRSDPEKQAQEAGKERRQVPSRRSDDRGHPWRALAARDHLRPADPSLFQAHQGLQRPVREVRQERRRHQSGLRLLHAERERRISRRGQRDPERGTGERAAVAEPAAGALHGARLRAAERSRTALGNRPRRRRSEHAGCARGRGAARCGAPRQEQPAPAALHPDRHQGPDGHGRPADDGWIPDAVRERPTAARRDAGREAACRRGDHHRQGEHGRVRLGQSAQLVRRADLQPVRDRPQRRQLQHGVGGGAVRQSRGVRHRRGVIRDRCASRAQNRTSWR
jgi:hypothetical protein